MSPDAIWLSRGPVSWGSWMGDDRSLPPSGGMELAPGWGGMVLDGLGGACTRWRDFRRRCAAGGVRPRVRQGEVRVRKVGKTMTGRSEPPVETMLGSPRRAAHCRALIA